MIKKTFGASLQTTDTTLYEVPTSKKAQWVLLYATNTSGSTTNFSVGFYDSSESATLDVFDGYSLSSKEFFKIGGEFNEFISMKEGDKIVASCATNDAITMLVSVIEENDIIQGG
jgi:hypothetical protein